MRYEQQTFSEVEYHTYPQLFSHLRTIAPLELPLVENGHPLKSSVFQFWDTEPDMDVNRLLSETRRICESSGAGYALYNNEAAREFLGHTFGQTHVRAYDKCVHPAQKSDFFRYWYLAENGGLWLDADLVLTASPLPLLGLHKPVFFQRMSYREQLTNWFIVAPAHNSLMQRIAEQALHNIEDDALFRTHVNKGDIVSITGPLVVRQIVARAIFEFCKNGDTEEPPAFIIDESVHDLFVQDGVDFIGRKLKYKMTDRSWQKWQRRLKRRTLLSEFLAKWGL